MLLTKNILRLALVIASLLLIPLVAMQFTAEVNWTLSDFVIAGDLLFGAGLTYVLVARLGRSGTYRLAVGVAVAAGLLLVWINLAVGIIGSENNPANLLYAGVLAVAFGGAISARFRPRGLARTMLAAALVQVAVPLVAALIWRPAMNLGMMQVLLFNAIFAVLWVVAGGLFWRAGGSSSIANQQFA